MPITILTVIFPLNINSNGTTVRYLNKKCKLVLWQEFAKHGAETFVKITQYSNLQCFEMANQGINISTYRSERLHLYTLNNM